MLSTFKGRTAVITGAGSGIGLSLTRCALEKDMNVVAADCDAERLNALEKSFPRTRQLHTKVADVSSSESVGRLSEFAYNTYGEVHLLCNNAGVAGAGYVWEHEPEYWRWIFDVNVMGAIHGIKHFVPRMIQDGHQGAIVNTASMGSFFSAEGMGAYGATKHAVLAISDSLQQDLTAVGAELTVSLLCPGPVRTRIFDKDLSPNGIVTTSSNQTWENYKELIANGMDPADVATITFDAVSKGEFWIIPDNSMINFATERYQQLVAVAGRPPD